MPPSDDAFSRRLSHDPEGTHKPYSKRQLRNCRTLSISLRGRAQRQAKARTLRPEHFLLTSRRACRHVCCRFSLVCHVWHAQHNTPAPVAASCRYCNHSVVCPAGVSPLPPSCPRMSLNAMSIESAEQNANDCHRFGAQLRALWHDLTSNDRHASLDTPYRNGAHQPLPQNRHTALTNITTTALDSRTDLDSPYREDLEAGHGVPTSNGRMSPRHSEVIEDRNRAEWKARGCSVWGNPDGEFQRRSAASAAGRSHVEEDRPLVGGQLRGAVGMNLGMGCDDQ